jgi:two-component system phosphate regulon sensor histidine kinase PhoR
VTALLLALLAAAIACVALLYRRVQTAEDALLAGRERSLRIGHDQGAVQTELDRMRKMLDTLQEAVIVVDEDVQIRDANRAAVRMLELGEAPVGAPLLERVRHPEIEKAARSALLEGTTVDRELTFVEPGENRRTLQLIAVPLRGERRAAILTLRDLTQVRHLETVRRDFVTALSHEIQTPLTAIRGYTETLAEGPVPPEDRERYLSVILRNTERLERLLQDLLLLSRAESGRLALEPVQIDVAESCSALVSELEVRFLSADLSAELEGDTSAVALADRRALDHVLLNLLDNAIKYTPSGGWITVRVTREADGVLVEVRDTGVGIPSRDLGRVFERFYRVDRSRSCEVGGSGLGLAIVRHLVEGMRGSISVESEVDRGSTFRVRLPAAPEGD